MATPAAPADPRQRYLHEPPFRALVEHLSALLDEGIFTPPDIRAALWLAVQITAFRHQHGVQEPRAPQTQQMLEAMHHVLERGNPD